MLFQFFQAFVSEYAVTGKDAGMGSLLASLGEAGFLIGVEKNRFCHSKIYISLFFLKKRVKLVHIYRS